MHELVLDTSLREAASLVGLGHEALRKFILGITRRPHQRSLRAMAQLYRRRAQGVSEARTSVRPAGHLKLLFARELSAAEAQVRSLFNDWREGRTPPPLAAELEKWLIRKLREEDAAEPRAPVRRRRR